MADRTAVEELLTRAAVALPVPDIDALAGSIGERLRHGPAPAVPPRWRRPVLIALVAAAAVALIVAVLPPTRRAVADFLGIGGVRISSDAPTGGPYSGLQLGDAVPLTEAQATVDFPVKIPTAAGYQQPDGIYLRTAPPVDMVSLVYPPGPDRPASPVAPVGVLISEFRAEPDFGFVKKLLSGGTDVEFVTVGGANAVWISGPVHELVYVLGDGSDHTELVRLATNTLLWVRDGVTYRLEGAIGRDDAIAIATSMR